MKIVQCPDIEACARAASADDETRSRPHAGWIAWAEPVARALAVFAMIVEVVVLVMSQLAPFGEFQRGLLIGGLLPLAASIPMWRLGDIVRRLSSTTSRRVRP
ncbi:MAG: hypothetical protein IPF82_14795 [Blastocatellia bacterium]|nr:hypothetical protein [Blastocatellia bacterium]